MVEDKTRLKLVLDAENKLGGPTRAAQNDIDSLTGTATDSTARIGAGFTAVTAAVTAVTVAITALAKKGIKELGDFERELGKLRGLGVTQRQVGQLGDAMEDLSVKTGLAVDQFTRASYDAWSAGFASVTDNIQAMTHASNLAAAANGSVSSSMDIMTSAVNAFGNSFGKTADIVAITVEKGKTTVDELAQGFGSIATSAQAAGVTLEDLLGTVAYMTQSGLSAAEAYTQLDAVLTSVQKPSADMMDILAHLGGQTMPELLAKYDNLDNVMRELNNAAHELGIGLAGAMGRKEGVRATTAAVNDEMRTEVAITKELSRANDDGAIAEQKAADARDNLGVQTDILGQKMESIWRDIGEEFAPAVEDLNDLLDDNKDSIEAVIMVLGRLSEEISTVVGWISDANEGFKEFLKHLAEVDTIQIEAPQHTDVGRLPGDPLNSWMPGPQNPFGRTSDIFNRGLSTRNMLADNVNLGLGPRYTPKTIATEPSGDGSGRDKEPFNWAFERDLLTAQGLKYSPFAQAKLNIRGFKHEDNLAGVLDWTSVLTGLTADQKATQAAAKEQERNRAEADTRASIMSGWQMDRFALGLEEDELSPTEFAIQQANVDLSKARALGEDAEVKRLLTKIDRLEDELAIEQKKEQDEKDAKSRQQRYDIAEARLRGLGLQNDILEQKKLQLILETDHMKIVQLTEQIAILEKRRSDQEDSDVARGRQVFFNVDRITLSTAEAAVEFWEQMGRERELSTLGVPTDV